MLRRRPGLRAVIEQIGQDMPKMSCIAGGPVRRTAALAARAGRSWLAGWQGPINGNTSLISSSRAPRRRSGPDTIGPGFDNRRRHQSGSCRPSAINKRCALLHICYLYYSVRKSLFLSKQLPGGRGGGAEKKGSTGNPTLEASGWHEWHDGGIGGKQKI